MFLLGLSPSLQLFIINQWKISFSLDFVFRHLLAKIFLKHYIIPKSLISESSNTTSCCTRLSSNRSQATSKCGKYILTSTVIYYWTDALQPGVYFLLYNEQKRKRHAKSPRSTRLFEVLCQLRRHLSISTVLFVLASCFLSIVLVNTYLLTPCRPEREIRPTVTSASTFAGLARGVVLCPMLGLPQIVSEVMVLLLAPVLH